MCKRWQHIFLPSVLLLCLVGCSRKSRVVDSSLRPCSWSDSLQPKHVIVIGDLQPTLWLEQKLLGRKQNDTVREKMIAATLSASPDLLLLLGDLVADGSKETHWAAFDSLIHPVHTAGIPVYSVVGNHDYGLLTNKGLPHFLDRFPCALTLPRLLPLADSVMLLVLDSNLDRLPSHVKHRQQERYRAMLARLDKDRAVKGVIVADHHPPFTQSSLHVNSDLKGMFAAPFLQARKTLLFLSGHVHSYERFEADGKIFVVTGGGGGPRREVTTKALSHGLIDKWNHGRQRPFNYVELTITPMGIECKALMLVENTFRVGDKWTMNFDVDN